MIYIDKSELFSLVTCRGLLMCTKLENPFDLFLGDENLRSVFLLPRKCMLLHCDPSLLVLTAHQSRLSTTFSHNRLIITNIGSACEVKQCKTRLTFLDAIFLT